MCGVRGQKNLNFGRGYPEKKGKKGAGREGKLGVGRGVNPGSRGSRLPCPPPLSYFSRK